MKSLGIYSGIELRRKNGLWTRADLSRAVGLSEPTLFRYLRAGFIPQPDIHLGRRKYYSTELAAKIRRILKKK